jgi:hypothetical protein
MSLREILVAMNALAYSMVPVQSVLICRLRTSSYLVHRHDIMNTYS